MFEHFQDKYRGNTSYCECNGKESKSLPQITYYMHIRHCVVSLLLPISIIFIGNWWTWFFWFLHTVAINYCFFFLSQFNALCTALHSIYQLGIFFSICVYTHTHIRHHVYINRRSHIHSFVCGMRMWIRTSLKCYPWVQFTNLHTNEIKAFALKPSKNCILFIYLYLFFHVVSFYELWTCCSLQWDQHCMRLHCCCFFLPTNLFVNVISPITAIR